MLSTIKMTEPVLDVINITI